MGLDSIELVMEFEKAFDIKIPDAVAEKLTTVGSVHNWIWEHIEKKQSTKCNSQVLFYKFRKYFVNEFGLPKDQVKPDTSLNDIIPWKNRREEYRKFADTIKFELPALTLSGAWETFLVIVGLITFVGGLIYALGSVAFYNASIKVFIYPLAGMAITLLTSFLLRPKRIYIQPAILKDFIKKILGLNYSFFAKKYGVNREDVESAINQVIVDKLGVGLEEISPEKSFTDDLGVD